MTKYMYLKYDRVTKFYHIPVIVDAEPKDYVQIVNRGLKFMNDPIQRRTLKDCELLYAGSFDDITGEFVLCKPEKLLDFADYLTEVTDGQESK